VYGGACLYGGAFGTLNFASDPLSFLFCLFLFVHFFLSIVFLGKQVRTGVRV
jgi:hypothetical protein